MQVGWRKYPLGEISNIIRGVSFKRSEGSSEPLDHYLPVLRAGNIQESLIIDKDLIWIPKSNVNKLQYIKKNDLIMCTSSGSANLVGKCAIAESDWHGCFGAFCVNIRSKEGTCEPHYLFHYLRSPAFTNWCKGSSGINIKNIRKSELENYHIPLPTLPEQKRIAAILDKADAIRRKRRQAIQLADEFLRSVFLDMFGDIFNNQKKWTMETVESLCSKIVDCPHSTPKYSSGKTIYPCIRTSDLQNGFLEWSTTKYVDHIEYENRVKRHTPISKDILYSREGERFGMAAMVEDSTTPCLGQRMMLFQAKPNKTEPEFLWYLLNTKGIYSQAERLVGGSTSPHVNVGDIKKFKAFCPPVKFQKKFSGIVVRISKMRRKFQKMEIKENLLFNSLSQQAFRGEL
jgi:type I restriction enzyme S subunit